jgi:hypothetical protein
MRSFEEIVARHQLKLEVLLCLEEEFSIGFTMGGFFDVYFTSFTLN